MVEHLTSVVLWDLDGTIQDSESLAKEGTRYGFQQVLGRDPTDDEFATLLGRPVSLIYKEWFSDAVASNILETGTRFYQERAGDISCYSGVTEVLHELGRRGYRLGVVTSKRRIHVINELKSKNLDVLFDVVVTQEDTPVHKPQPDPLMLALRHLQSEPSEAVYIGDQPSDMEAARAAGIDSIAALWGAGQYARLNLTTPTMFAYTPMDILTYLER